MGTPRPRVCIAGRTHECQIGERGTDSNTCSFRIGRRDLVLEFILNQMSGVHFHLPITSMNDVLREVIEETNYQRNRTHAAHVHNDVRYFALRITGVTCGKDLLQLHLPDEVEI
ncbi:hypothetical protein TNCV_3442791 [Trichonephila clavipes]|nr:hypothetical protein TNCV_3442791 [Trichonephila clavipes]